jgi:hypothetical protein
MSNPQARVALSFSCTRQAVAGKTMSGVTVPTTMRSSSEAAMPRRSRASTAAGTQMSLVGVPGSTMCRRSMPVRVRIHSSEVSTNFSRSALVNTFSGTCRPSEVMRARGFLGRGGGFIRSY